MSNQKDLGSILLLRASLGIPSLFLSIYFDIVFYLPFKIPSILDFWIATSRIYEILSLIIYLISIGILVFFFIFGYLFDRDAHSTSFRRFLNLYLIGSITSLVLSALGRFLYPFINRQIAGDFELMMIVYNIYNLIVGLINAGIIFVLILAWKDFISFAREIQREKLSNAGNLFKVGYFIALSRGLTQIAVILLSFLYMLVSTSLFQNVIELLGMMLLFLIVIAGIISNILLIIGDFKIGSIFIHASPHSLADPNIYIID